ncbi:MAG TPA: hypothetical protein EYN91_11780 [Candidatus Melainabacteria bacterium]|nr:hypothetical protein [Candidatus Melainabacteria bacterium]HIN64799.1 hypothetical protein [Candidatus Obscuribacterales bacterium]
MAKTIEIQATVPITNPILLSHFYQYKVEQFPTLKRENFSIRLWFDTECINCNPSMPSEERLRVRPMMISQFKSTIQIHDVADEFADFVLLPTEKQIFEQTLSEQYFNYSEQVYDLLFGLLNRILSFIRAHQGQFWVEELRLEDRKDLRPILAGYAHVSEIHAKLVEPEIPFSWNPLRKPATVLMRNQPDPRELQPDDWDDIWIFAESSGRTDLVMELINGAYRLAMQGHSRAALTEAVTALETALHRFARRPKLELLSDMPLKRIQAKSVPKAIEHLGFTQSIRVLLPLLLSEDTLHADLIGACDAAVTLRHDVVHNGRRFVDRIDEHLAAIAELCALLMNSSQATEGS